MVMAKIAATLMRVGISLAGFMSVLWTRQSRAISRANVTRLLSRKAHSASVRKAL